MKQMFLLKIFTFRYNTIIVKLCFTNFSIVFKALSYKVSILVTVKHVANERNLFKCNLGIETLVTLHLFNL